MSIFLRPIVPKKPPAQYDRGQIQAALQKFAIDLVGEMGKYPPWMPWKRPPKKGPYKDGKRTGSLMRGWLYSDLRPESVLIVNAVPYAGSVQGYRAGAKGQRQTAIMAARGWQNLSDRAKEVWQRHLPNIRYAVSGKK